MVQQIRQSEVQYSCVLPIDSLTGNPDEEMMTFGITAEDAKKQAEHLLSSNYGCNCEQIIQLLQQAKIEPLAHWCTPNDQS